VIGTDPYGNTDASPAKRTFTVKAPPTENKPDPGKPGGGSTAGGSAPAGGKIDAKLNTFWRLDGKRTKLQTVTVANAPASAKVTISCKGKGWKFRKVASTVRGSKLKLAVKFKGRKLPARTVITVVVTKEGWISKTFKYTTRAGKFPKLTLS